MHPNEKAAILERLKAEKVLRLKEQDQYRATIKRFEDAPNKNGLPAKFALLDWETLGKHMQGESWPPTCQDWKNIMGLEYDQIPRRKILDQINDWDIRFRTFHYFELADHTLRIRAGARFYSLYGAVDIHVLREFLFWRECSKVKSMLAQTTGTTTSISRLID